MINRKVSMLNAQQGPRLNPNPPKGLALALTQGLMVGEGERARPDSNRWG